MTIATTTRQAASRSRTRESTTAPPLAAAPAASPDAAGGFAGALFVIATHKVRDRAVPSRWLPYGTEHAWRPGTRRTLCGEWTSGWIVLWERRFSAQPAAACPRCVEATLPEESRRRLDRLAG